MTPKTSIRVRNRAGKLSNLSTIPLDVLFEIFSYLLPLDLLHLAWTDSALRWHLMHRSSAFVWRSARNNIGLPGCPPDLSEPQYASLAFNDHCTGCLAPKRVTRPLRTHWALRVRYCFDCATRFLCQGASIRPLCTKHPELIMIAPYAIQKPLVNDALYHLQTINEIVPRLKELHGTELNSLCDEWRSYIKQATDHAKECEKWLAEVADKRRLELQNIRVARGIAIMRRLDGLGWGDELQAMPSGIFNEHPLVKRLTERNWGNIRESMIIFMKNFKEQRMLTG